MSTQTQKYQHHKQFHQGKLTAQSDFVDETDLIDNLEKEYAAGLKQVRSEFNSGKTKSLDWRIGQLKAIRKAFVENGDAIKEAMAKDLGRPPQEAILIEVAGIIREVDVALANITSWMKPDTVSHAGMVPGNSKVEYQPKGVVFILAPFNYPINLAFCPMIAAIAAGNSVILKPSEVSENCADVINDIVHRYLDNSCIKCYLGAIPETTALLRLRFDHIIYTGSGVVGRIVMKAASRHLTPCTLELGGKSPAYIDKSANIKVIAKRLANGKSVNNGQTCVAPDYVLLDEAIADKFIDELLSTFKAFYGEDPQKSESYGRIVNERHWDRVTGLLDPESHSGKVLLGGIEKADRSDRYIPPTVVLNPALDSPLMNEEIFSMGLPIIIVKGPEEAIEIIQSRDHPLALYCAAEDEAVCDKFVNETISGGVCLNDYIAQLTNPNLPFGGVGPAGMGAYHGEWGFKECSHKKAVMSRVTSTDPAIRYPPYASSAIPELEKMIYAEPTNP